MYVRSMHYAVREIEVKPALLEPPFVLADEAARDARHRVALARLVRRRTRRRRRRRVLQRVEFGHGGAKLLLEQHGLGLALAQRGAQLRVLSLKPRDLRFQAPHSLRVGARLLLAARGVRAVVVVRYDRGGCARAAVSSRDLDVCSLSPFSPRVAADRGRRVG